MIPSLDGPTRLAPQDVAFTFLDLHHPSNGRHRPFREGQVTLREPPEELDLLVGRDAELAVEPEPVDSAADLPVAVTDEGDEPPHPRFADPAGDLLVVPDGGVGERRSEVVVAVPGLPSPVHAVPREDDVLVVHDAGLERDE